MTMIYSNRKYFSFRHIYTGATPTEEDTSKKLTCNADLNLPACMMLIANYTRFAKGQRSLAIAPNSNC